MHTPIDFLEAKKNKEIKKLYKKTGYSKELEKQGTFVARFSYPIEIGDIINFVERMGVIHEDKILPELYKIQKIIAVKED